MIRELADDVKRIVNEKVDQAKASVDAEIDTQVAETEAKYGNMAQTAELSQAMELMSKIPGIAEAAAQANMPLKDWVLDTLGKVVDPNLASILIPVNIYGKLRATAHGRGVSVDVITTSRDMTDWLQSGLDNGRI